MTGTPLNCHDRPRTHQSFWPSVAEYAINWYAPGTISSGVRRGIVHPIDDARSTNPPSNPELLDMLARDFVASGYNVKQLIRVICNSAAYGLSSAPVEY